MFRRLMQRMFKAVILIFVIKFNKTFISTQSYLYCFTPKRSITRFNLLSYSSNPPLYFFLPFCPIPPPVVCTFIVYRRVIQSTRRISITPICIDVMRYAICPAFAVTFSVNCYCCEIAAITTYHSSIHHIRGTSHRF